jgi:hypothetical protein
MQRYSDNLSESDRRVARKWTLASLGVYGALLAGFILYAAFNPAPPAQLASTAVSTAPAAKPSREDIFDKFAKVTQRRFCGQVSC